MDAVKEGRKVARPERRRAKEVVDRLRRIEGQIAGIRRMYESDRYCIDVLDQIAAARRGLEGAAQVILEDHVTGCVRDALEGGDAEERTAELLEAVRRYVRSA